MCVCVYVYTYVHFSLITTTLTAVCGCWPIDMPSLCTLQSQYSAHTPANSDEELSLDSVWLTVSAVEHVSFPLGCGPALGEPG